MAVNSNPETLLELLACPSCGNELTSEFAGLRCTRCDRSFPFNGRVPVLLDTDDSQAGSSTFARLHYAILSNPRLYDFHQAHGGGRPIAARVRKELDALGRGTLLDIGAGTGMVARVIPADTRYVWLDNDALKLRGFLSKAIDCYAVLGDAARLPFCNRGVDWTVMVEVSHHLPDGALRACLDEAARVTRERFVFVDWVRGPRLRSKLLGQLDLGRFPRTEGELLLALEMSFEIAKVERFRINHDHVLCVCVPRRTAV